MRAFPSATKTMANALVALSNVIDTHYQGSTIVVAEIIRDKGLIAVGEDSSVIVSQ